MFVLLLIFELFWFVFFPVMMLIIFFYRYLSYLFYYLCSGCFGLFFSTMPLIMFFFIGIFHVGFIVYVQSVLICFSYDVTENIFILSTSFMFSLLSTIGLFRFVFPMMLRISIFYLHYIIKNTQRLKLWGYVYI